MNFLASTDPSYPILRSLIGIIGLLAIAYFLSSNRKKINPRIVLGGLLLQLTIAFGVLKIGWVEDLFGWVAHLFAVALQVSVEASAFVFGPLADLGSMNEIFSGQGFVFAFMALPSILFFSALSSLLYYFGILQVVVRGMAWVMSRIMRLSGAESLAAAANVFVGQTEAPLVVKPYVPTMTRSELLALMVGGMATIAGSVFAIYMGMLGGESETERLAFGKFLLCASAMNAPAALLLAKILMPEEEAVNTEIKVSQQSMGRNPIDALANGTTQGLKLALNVGAMLISFYALILLINYALAYLGTFSIGDGGNLNQWVASATDGGFEKLSLQAIFGLIFAPIAWLIGISSGEVLKVGQLIGTKLFATEFFAFADLAKYKEEGMSLRSVYLATFALCGFANFMSIGIQIGGIGAIAENRRSELAKLGLKALIGGTLASLLSATIAGFFL